MSSYCRCDKYMEGKCLKQHPGQKPCTRQDSCINPNCTFYHTNTSYRTHKFNKLNDRNQPKIGYHFETDPKVCIAGSTCYNYSKNKCVKRHTRQADCKYQEECTSRKCTYFHHDIKARSEFLGLNET